MVLSDAATLAARDSLATRITEGKVSPEEGLRKFLEIDPFDPIALLGLGVLYSQQGQLDEAAQFLWRAAEADPSNWDPYMALAALGKDDARPSPLTGAVLVLGFRKALANEERYREETRESPTLSRREMEEMVALGAHLQSTEPQSVTDRLRPHRLVHELQYPPATGVRPEVVEQILEYRDVCQPLLLGTLRGWGLRSFRDDHDFPAEAALALLGEIGDLATLPAMLEFLDVEEDGVREAAAWAVWRLTERSPRDVLPKLRQAAAAGPSSFRWGLAAAYGMMRGIEGVQEALLDLLQGLENLDAEERGSVFCAVTWALQESQGRPARAQVLALIARYSKILDQETQRDCLLPADEDEPPPPLSVYDFCCEPADEQEDDEEVGPVFVRPKIGRNDPCWCGSGKKYKKCHLSADDQREREAATNDQTIFEQVISFMEQELRDDEMRAAITTFFGDVKEINQDDEASFMDWVVHDYPVRRFGRTLFQEFLRRRGDRLRPEMRRLAETHARSTFHLLEVQDVKPGSGIQVRDLFQGGEFFAHDVSASRRSSRWDAIFGRILDFGARQELSGVYMLLRRSILPPFRDWATADHEEKGGDWPAYLRANSHHLRRQILALHEQLASSLRMATAEGDPLVFSKAVYEVLDEAAFRRAAESSPVHASDEDGDFSWFEAPATSDDEPRRVLGHLRIQGGRLLLECQSRQRLERGRTALASLAPGALKHLGDEFTDWRQAMEQSRSRPPGAPAEPLAPEVEREVLEEFYTRHYAGWPDTPLPALGGRTPREAVRTPDGREKVIALLKDFENSNERERRVGKYVYDFSGIQAELGIDSL